MHRIIRIKAYEAEHGPHFNDEHARKAVNKMENEDGTSSKPYCYSSCPSSSSLIIRAHIEPFKHYTNYDDIFPIKYWSTNSCA